MSDKEDFFSRTIKDLHCQDDEMLKIMVLGLFSLSLFLLCFDTLMMIENFSYVDKREANNKNLAYLDPHGRAIIAVDSKTDLSNDTNPPVVLNTTDGNYTVNYNGLRKSVRLESKRRYPAGSLIIADFDHLPFGVRER